MWWAEPRNTGFRFDTVRDHGVLASLAALRPFVVPGADHDETVDHDRIHERIGLDPFGQVDSDRDGGGDAEVDSDGDGDSDGDADTDERGCGDGRLCPEPQECDLGLCADPGEPAWRIDAGVTGEDLHSVTARADGRFFAVGAAATVVRREAAGWAPFEPAFNGEPVTLRDAFWIEAVGGTGFFVAGDSRTASHFDLSRWVLVQAGDPGAFWSLWGCS